MLQLELYGGAGTIYVNASAVAFIEKTGSACDIYFTNGEYRTVVDDGAVELLTEAYHQYFQRMRGELA